MLNKDFVKWVAIAFVIATPIAYYAMNKWLENFAYKTELSWWIFALAGLLALGIALLTVSWQSWRAATRNPVEAWKTKLPVFQLRVRCLPDFGFSKIGK
jgi:putative ABC transport system permease protein